MAVHMIRSRSAGSEETVETGQDQVCGCYDNIPGLVCYSWILSSCVRLTPKLDKVTFNSIYRLYIE